MLSPAYRAYRTILTANDAVLSSVFTAMEDNVGGRGENLFDFLASQGAFHCRIGVVYDNAANIGRPTLVMSPDADPAAMGPHDGQVAVLNDAWFPAGVEWVDRNLVTFPDQVTQASVAAMEMMDSAAQFAIGVTQAMERGGMTEFDLAQHPGAQMGAQMIQQLSMVFSVGYQNGVSLRVPPPGARHVPREKWVPQRSGAGRSGGGIELS